MESNQQNKRAKQNQRHRNEDQTDSNQRGGEMGIRRERRGRVKSRNMYKGSMDKDNRVRI